MLNPVPDSVIVTGVMLARTRAGVTAISSGNHAVAVAYAAMRLGISAKVVMLKTSSSARLALCRQFGAEVLIADDGPSGFARVREIEREDKQA